MSVRGHGPVLPCGLGEAGGLCMSGGLDKASLAAMEQEQGDGCASCCLCPTRLQGKGGMVGMCRAPAPPSWPQDGGFSAPVSV